MSSGTKDKANQTGYLLTDKWPTFWRLTETDRPKTESVRTCFRDPKFRYPIDTTNRFGGQYNALDDDIIASKGGTIGLEGGIIVSESVLIASESGIIAQRAASFLRRAASSFQRAASSIRRAASLLRRATLSLRWAASSLWKAVSLLRGRYNRFGGRYYRFGGGIVTGFCSIPCNCAGSCNIA